MNIPDISQELVPLIDFEFPMSDIVAVIPYVLPLIFVGTLLFFYQRYMDREALKRNIIVFVVLVCYLSSFLMVLYAGFGAPWWWSGDEFGSWWGFVTAIQGLTDVVFGSVLTGIGYIVLIGIGFSILSYYVIIPPEPDYVKMRDEMKELGDFCESMKADVEKTRKEKRKVDEENKKLSEFISEKEERLKTLQEEVEQLREQIDEKSKALGEAESKLKEVPSVPESEDDSGEGEQELLETISRKDQTISKLQAEIDELKSKEGTPEAATVSDGVVENLKTQLKECQSKIESYSRRAETASEVSDSVISDLVELISQVESSNLDKPAKEAITKLVENLGRAVGRVSGSKEERDPGEPKIEMIGAVMMVHEIVDSIKKMTRQG